MREINNNTSKPSNVVFQGIQPSQNEITEIKKTNSTENVETTDLSKMPSEVIGRSQVPQSSLENDMKFLTNKPETVEKANKMLDFLVDKKGYSYEQATEIVNAAITEFNL